MSTQHNESVADRQTTNGNVEDVTPAKSGLMVDVRIPTKYVFGVAGLVVGGIIGRNFPSEAAFLRLAAKGAQKVVEQAEEVAS